MTGLFHFRIRSTVVRFSRILNKLFSQDCFVTKAISLDSSSRLLRDNIRGGVLEDTFSSPWPRSLKSSRIALSSARGQHYFLNG